MNSRRIALGLLIASTSLTYAEAGISLNPGDSRLVASALAVGTDTVDAYRVSSRDTVRTATIITKVEAVVKIDSANPDLSVPNSRRISVSHVSPKGDTSLSITEIDQVSLGMHAYQVRAKTDSGFVVFTPNGLGGWCVPPRGTLRRISVERTSPPFPDDGASPWIIRCLPFGRDSVVELSVFNMWDQKDHPLAYHRLREETVRYRGQIDTCWVIQVRGRVGPPGYDYFCWVSKRDRLLLKTAFLKAGEDVEYWSYRR